MNKYELALVVSAKIEDDDRAQTVEKAKAFIKRRLAGDSVTDIARDMNVTRQSIYFFFSGFPKPTPGEDQVLFSVSEDMAFRICMFYYSCLPKRGKKVRDHWDEIM